MNILNIGRLSITLANHGPSSHYMPRDVEALLLVRLTTAKTRVHPRSVRHTHKTVKTT